MISILLTISFIIHFITLFFILILYQRTKLNNNENPVEFERMMQQYLNEIKEENNQLLQQLSPTLKKSDQPSSYESMNFSGRDELSNYEPPVEVIREEDEIETSQTAKILSLAEQGYEHASIAQKLTCGKTEVELVLRFQAEKGHNI